MIMQALKRQIALQFESLILPKPSKQYPLKHLGSNYAGYAVYTKALPKSPIVYSFGVGEDISFDLEVIRQYNAQVYAFDPTPKSIAWMESQSLPKSFLFFDFGIADFDGLVQFNPPENPNHVSCTVLDRPKTADRAFKVPVYSINSIMKMLNHRTIDILKMDIEGAEYAVLEDIIRSKVSITQILVEFHHRFPGVGLQATKRTIQLLQQSRYVMFYRSSNLEEFSFIRIP